MSVCHFARLEVFIALTSNEKRNEKALAKKIRSHTERERVPWYKKAANTGRKKCCQTKRSKETKKGFPLVSSIKPETKIYCKPELAAVKKFPSGGLVFQACKLS